MAEESVNGAVRFEPEDSCPPLTAAVTGLQLVFVVIALVVVPVVIVVRTAEQPESYLTWAVFAMLVVCGVTTFLQALRFRRLGIGHVMVIGTSEPAIAICIAALTEGGPAMVASLVVLSSALKFVVAARLSWLRRVITPVVSGTVLMLIAATVILTVFKILTHVPHGVSVSPYAAPAASAVTLAVVTLLLLRAPRSLRLWSPIIGVALGCAVALPFGLYDTDLVLNSPWVGIPQTGWPGFHLPTDLKFWALLPAFLVVSIITSIKAVADVSAIQRVSRNQPRANDFRLVQGGINVNGFSDFLAGIAGTMPTMTVSPTVSLVNLTGVAARTVGIWAGVAFILLALLPKLTAVLLAIPASVSAAYIMIIMGLVFVEGVNTIAQDGIDHRKAVVVAVSFWVGMGFQNHAIFADLLSGTWNALLSNSVTSGGFAAALMVGFMELTSVRRKRLQVDLDQSSMPEIDRFLRDFAAEKHWNEASTESLRAIGEETISIMALEAGANDTDKQRRLIVTAQVEEDVAELEFLSAAYDVENLEDRLAYLNDEPEVLDEHEISYRLLRHYAKSVRHQKFHDIDVITVQVTGARAR